MTKKGQEKIEKNPALLSCFRIHFADNFDKNYDKYFDKNIALFFANNVYYKT